MSGASSVFRYFAVCSPGLEAILKTELGELGLDGTVMKGGVGFQGPLETLWQAAHLSRIAESIRLRLKPFVATNFAQLELELAKLPFHAYLPAHAPFEVSVSCSESQLYHTGAIEERFRRVIEGAWTKLGKPTIDVATISKPKFYVRLLRNEVTVSVDATGERLHRRGYRTHVGIAPLRETLAAACCRLLASQLGADGIRAVWDPCCGSGTLLCEWLQVRLAIAPTAAGPKTREFAFERFPSHPKTRYQSYQAEHLGRAHSVSQLGAFTAYGSDRDPRALSAAETNLRQAKVRDFSTLLSLDMRVASSQIPEGTAVLTNLPYGVRLKPGSNAPQPFTLLDNLLRTRPDLRPALAISTERPPRIGPTGWEAGCHFANGGLAVTAWILRNAAPKRH